MNKKNKAPDTGKVSEAGTSSRAALDSEHNIRTVHLSPLERRAVLLLLDRPYLTYDLEKAARCRYSPNVIKCIRRRGIEVITTEVKIPGRKNPVGLYSISPCSVDLARRSALGEGGA